MKSAHIHLCSALVSVIDARPSSRAGATTRSWAKTQVRRAERRALNQQLASDLHDFPNLCVAAERKELIAAVSPKLPVDEHTALQWLGALSSIEFQTLTGITVTHKRRRVAQVAAH